MQYVCKPAPLRYWFEDDTAFFGATRKRMERFLNRFFCGAGLATPHDLFVSVDDRPKDTLFMEVGTDRMCNHDCGVLTIINIDHNQRSTFSWHQMSHMVF